MVCKKCGCDTLIAQGDWLKCPNCGASFFNINPDEEFSATKQLDLLENESTSLPASKEEKKREKAEKKAAKKAEKAKKNKQRAKEEDAGSGKTEAVIPAEQADGADAGANTADETPASDAQEAESKSSKKQKKEKKPASKLKGFVEFMIPIVAAVILALVLKTFIFANAVVPSGSMRSTIEAGDRIIASRISYLSEDPERYDIIIFKYPDDETQAFVKRIVGLPGETITVVNGVVYYSDTDGQLYRADDSYVTLETATGDFGPYYIPCQGEVISVSGGYCYAENGMEVGSLDFLTMYCKQDKITGEYVVAQNLYFCMGDNRNDSHDSRYWDNTYVAEDKIIGKVLFRYYPDFANIE